MSTQTMNQLPPSNPGPRGSAKPLNILLAAIGSLVLLTMLISTTRSAVATLSSSHVVKTASIQGVTSLDVKAQSGTFSLKFAEISEATLEVRSNSGTDWKLQREGQELVVRAPNSWGDWCFFGCTAEDNKITLTLPQQLNDGSLDASLSLSAGEFTANGNFDDLVLDVGAGLLELNGASNTLDATLGAGRADLSLANVQSATLDVSAGRMNTELTGQAPGEVNASVSAGMLDLVLPDVPYDVTSDVSAGSVQNNLDTSSTAKHLVSVETSAGTSILRPGSAPASGK